MNGSRASNPSRRRNRRRPSGRWRTTKNNRRQASLRPAQADARTSFRDHQTGARFRSVPATCHAAWGTGSRDHDVESEADVRARGHELRSWSGILGKSIPLLAFVGRSGRNRCWQPGPGNHANAPRLSNFALVGRNYPNGVRQQTALQPCRSTISCLIAPIAFAGLSPFGQESVQFMIVWQRYNLKGSSNSSSRWPVASSRESAIQR